LRVMVTQLTVSITLSARTGPPEHVSLWRALRNAERKQSTLVTLDTLEERPQLFVEAHVPDAISELKVKIADGGVAAADDGAAGAAAGDLGDGAGVVAASAVHDSADDAVVVVTLPESVGWVTENVRHMFVRSCWVKLYGIIVSKMEGRAGTKAEGIILMGNPGIGKSWFLSYVLYRVASEMPTRVVVFESVAEEKLWVFGADGSVRQHDWQERRHLVELNNPSTIYLFDPAGHSTGQTREPYRCIAYTIVASSPNKNNYRDMLKHGGEILFMPPWLLAELRAIASFMPKPLSAEEVEQRFARHGGISRAVLSDKPRLWDAELTRAVQSCNLDAVMRSVGLEDAVESATHKVVAYKVIEDGATAFTDVRVDFASPWIARQVFEQYYTAKRAELVIFLRSAEGNATVSGVCGALFEQLMHRTLSNGGTFKVRRLGPDVDPATTEVQVHPPNVEKVRGVDALRSFRGSDQRIYLQPEFGNFPVLDGILLNATDGALLAPFVGIQSTVSLEHPLKQAPLVSILECLGTTGAGSFDVVFVVWPSAFDKYQIQKFLTTEKTISKAVPKLITTAVRQWVLELPLQEPAGSPK